MYGLILNDSPFPIPDLNTRNRRGPPCDPERLAPGLIENTRAYQGFFLFSHLLICTCGCEAAAAEVVPV